MANVVYPKFKEAMWKGTYDLSSADIRLMLVTSGYSPTDATDEFVGNGSTPIPSGDIIARTAAALTSVTVTLGVLNAANVTFASVTSGSVATYLIMYLNTGSDSTSPLVARWDVATGLPLTTNGGDVANTWDTGTNKIIKL